MLGALLICLVDGWKPAGRGLWFALCPDLAWLIRIASIGIDEIKSTVVANGGAAANSSLVRFCGILNIKFDGVFIGECLWKLNV